MCVYGVCAYACVCVCERSCVCVLFFVYPAGTQFPMHCSGTFFMQPHILSPLFFFSVRGRSSSNRVTISYLEVKYCYARVYIFVNISADKPFIFIQNQSLLLKNIEVMVNAEKTPPNSLKKVKPRKHGTIIMIACSYRRRLVKRPDLVRWGSVLNF